ncbi:hypothetical protein DFK10_14510 [Salibaculum griseiflavum]|uniref:Uncharacterized protein n=1 Tax=Salibaculum griseiflavum TaxID=1914409 RepID=A0A2V1P205_9RHOB|nr:hypothetical protein DFK10_14510 [Salibaculum griseiflavum]
MLPSSRQASRETRRAVPAPAPTRALRAAGRHHRGALGPQRRPAPGRAQSSRGPHPRKSPPPAHR